MRHNESTENEKKKTKRGGLSFRKADSIQKKIQIAMIEVVIVTMLILGIVSCYLNYSSTYSTLVQSMNEVSSVAAGRVEWEITAYKNIVQELGRTARLANPDYSTEEKQAIIDEKVDAYSLIRGKLIGLDGIAQIDGTDYSEREYFQYALKGETYFSEPLIAKTDGALSLIAAAPVWEGGLPNTKVVGVVFLSLPADLLDTIMSDINLSDNSGAYIIDKRGTTAAHSVEGMTKSQNNTIENAKSDAGLAKLASLEQKMLAGEDGIGTYFDGGTLKFISYSPIQNTDGWSLAVTAPAMDFFASTVVGILITIAIMIASIVIAGIIAYRIGKGIGEPIRQCAERLQMVKTGDLHTPVPEINTNDETGILADATRSIVESMNAIIGDIKHIVGTMARGDFSVKSNALESYVGDFEEIVVSLRELRDIMSDTLMAIRSAASQVSAGSGQMSESAQSLAEGATDQAGAVQELMATIENVTAMVSENARNAEESYRQALAYEKDAAEGNSAMDELTKAMEKISESSGQIGNIIAEIEDIASQTNLLSLNASIEAARAGEAGKGFAVVADQIGKLASDSAKSAANTRQMIENTVNEVTEGNRITERTSEVLKKVVEGMRRLGESSKDSADSAEVQAESMKQIEQGIEQISSVVQNNSAAAEETSATSEELSAQAISLNEEIGKFTLLEQ